ncbi:hypothetical protein GGS26DRAFT_381383 [Hypomontagnella submonticulosa]|nr:hypothetical protein GGS26DRAFT_381383 [Hypomontagnella submonticulosa]
MSYRETPSANPNMLSKFLAIGSALTLVVAMPTDPVLGLEPRLEGCSNYDATLYYLKDYSSIGIGSHSHGWCQWLLQFG